jgi:hypothetical protein
MKIKLFLSVILFISTLSNSFADKYFGYKDKDGNYKWFDEKSDSSFTDENNRYWAKVTDNQDKWNKAMIIRNANIYALLDLGFDTMKVLKDVQLLNENSILFTRFSKLENYKDYVFYWKTAFNSTNFKFNARKSGTISETDLSLKFYTQKAHISNAAALGLVKKSFFEHFAEASIELIKKYKYKINRITIETYLKNYMHLNNAIELINERKLEMDRMTEVKTELPSQ